MVHTNRQAPEERRATALALVRDFRALLDALDQETDGAAHLPELASIRANAERGLQLARQLRGDGGGDND